jgi:hypothetical protein
MTGTWIKFGIGRITVPRPKVQVDTLPAIRPQNSAAHISVAQRVTTISAAAVPLTAKTIAMILNGAPVFSTITRDSVLPAPIAADGEEVTVSPRDGSGDLLLQGD